MEWQSFLEQRPIGVFATVGPDGGPHAVPVEIVVHDGSVYVWCRATSVKCRNAKREGKAAVVAYKGDSGVLVRGAARVLDSSMHEAVTKKFLAKYPGTQTYENDALIEVVPEKISVFE